jgi:amine acid ABC transporter, permease protein, 3-TM region, His/Glu/Gln/Arg/opine family
MQEYFSKLGERLYDVFIKGGRYMYIVNGLGNTILITVFALVIGVIIGVAIALVRVSYANNRNKFMRIPNAVCGLYLTVIRGTPMVVQLMIMYFVILKSAGPLVVAVISFGLNSAAYVAEVIRSGIQSVDKGQTEAGRSLGLTQAQTLFSIVIPQAFRNVAPAIFNEFISLLKETSVAGYVGIHDLTKGGEIIRSITYDSFPPLILVASVYLIMVIGLTRILTVIEGRFAKSGTR